VHARTHTQPWSSSAPSLSTCSICLPLSQFSGQLPVHLPTYTLPSLICLNMHHCCNSISYKSDKSGITRVFETRYFLFIYLTESDVRFPEWGGGVSLSPSRQYRTLKGVTQPSIDTWVADTFPGEQSVGTVLIHHRSPLIIEVKNTWSFTSTPHIRLHSMMIKLRNKFTFIGLDAFTCKI